MITDARLTGQPGKLFHHVAAIFALRVAGPEHALSDASRIASPHGPTTSRRF